MDLSFSFFKWIGNLLWRFLLWITRNPAERGLIGEIPSKTIILTPFGSNTPWWHMGAMGDKPAMQIVTKFTVTNISSYDVYIPTAVLKTRTFKSKRVQGFALVKNMQNDYYGGFLIPSGGITELTVDFWITPPLKKENEVFE